MIIALIAVVMVIVVVIDYDTIRVHIEFLLTSHDFICICARLLRVCACMVM